MATLSGFLNPKKVSTEKFVLSDRFCDENNTPCEWEIRCLSGDEIMDVQNASTIEKKIGDKVKTELDIKKYQKMLLAKSVMTPDPNAADLQEAYGVKGFAMDVFPQMLTADEFNLLFAKVSRINGLDKDISKLVGKAKN